MTDPYSNEDEHLEIVWTPRGMERQPRRRPQSETSVLVDGFTSALVGAGMTVTVPPSGYTSTGKERLRDRIERETLELEQAAQVMASLLNKRAGELERLRMYPAEDPFAEDDDVVLRFEKRFGVGGKPYTYVASRVDGLWYLTGGRAPQGLCWDDFVDFMGLGVDEVTDVRTGKRVFGL